MMLADEQSNETDTALVERLSDMLGLDTDFDNYTFSIKRGNLRRLLAALRAAEPAPEDATDADREAAKRHQQRFLTEGISETALLLETLSNHRALGIAQGRAEATTEAAKLVERRMEQRFEEYGTREPDTNATYYNGRAGEIYAALDEEDEEIVAAIRALGKTRKDSSTNG